VKEQWKKEGIRLTGSILDFAEAMHRYAYEGYGSQHANGIGYLANPKNPKGEERAVRDYYTMLCRDRAEREQRSIVKWTRWQEINGGRWMRGDAEKSSATRPAATLGEEYGRLLVWANDAETWQFKKKLIPGELFRQAVDGSAFELPEPAPPPSSSAPPSPDSTEEESAA
jgi:hypothetical protein